MTVKLSELMYLVLRDAAKFGYQGEMVCANRRTEDALLRRGLITYDYDRKRFASGEHPVLTVAGWAVIGERPADTGRLSFEDAWIEAHAKAAPVCTCPVLERKYYGGDKLHHPCCALCVGEPCGVRILDFGSSRFVYCTKPKGHDKAHGLYAVTEDAPAHSAPRPANTDSKENDDVSIKEGPLTERQVRIIEGLLQGKRHWEISRTLSTPDGTVTVNVVKQECQNITAKFKARTITQAVFIYSEAKAYRKAAQEILKGLIPVPIDETEVHTNHVLEDLAKLYQGRHDAWMPR